MREHDPVEPVDPGPLNSGLQEDRRQVIRPRRPGGSVWIWARRGPVFSEGFRALCRKFPAPPSGAKSRVSVVPFAVIHLISDRLRYCRMICRPIANRLPGRPASTAGAPSKCPRITIAACPQPRILARNPRLKSGAIEHKGRSRDSAVNDILRNPERSPRLSTVEQLANALDITLWQLLSPPGNAVDSADRERTATAARACRPGEFHGRRPHPDRRVCGRPRIRSRDGVIGITLGFGTIGFGFVPGAPVVIIKGDDYANEIVAVYDDDTSEAYLFAIARRRGWSGSAASACRFTNSSAAPA